MFSFFTTRQYFGKAKKKVISKLPRNAVQRKDLLLHILKEEGVEVATERLQKSHWKDISKEIRDMVITFFCCDDISRQAPGMKDVMTVYKDKTKEKHVKRHMYFTLRETYSFFCKENPHVKMGISKFCTLRPPYVLTTSETPANVCVCIYHANVQLLLDAISWYSFPKRCHEFVDSLTCFRGSEACMSGLCSLCINNYFEMRSTIVDKNILVKWIQWENNVDQRVEKVSKEGLLREVLDLLAEKLPSFLRHCFVKDCQSLEF
jgi:hypothetical protein